MAASQAELQAYAAQQEGIAAQRRSIQRAQPGRGKRLRCSECGHYTRRLNAGDILTVMHYCEMHPTAPQVPWSQALGYAWHMAGKADTVDPLDVVGFTLADFAQARRLRRKWRPWELTAQELTPPPRAKGLFGT